MPNPVNPEPKIFATKAQRHEGFYFVIRSYVHRIYHARQELTTKVSGCLIFIRGQVPRARFSRPFSLCGQMALPQYTLNPL